MPRCPPCCAPGCPEPDNSSGQWQYIPQAKCVELSLEYQVACVCKRADCLRTVGLKEAKRVPGRKRVAGGDAVPTAVPLRADCLPRPPILVSIDEIWAERCAPHSNARLPSALARAG